MFTMSVDSVFFFRIMTLFSCFVTAICMMLAWGKFNNEMRNVIPYPRGQLPNMSAHGFNASSTLSSLEFYSSYHVKGFLRLLHSNLNEPIEVWYSKEHSKSRIDYYNGEVKTYQDGNIGLFVKVVPKYNSVSKTHSIGCWKRISKGKIKPQSILPTQWWWPFKATLEAFKYVGNEEIEGKVCTKWQYSPKILERNNVYTFWVENTDPPKPVRYEMNGYDTMMTSYYDKYIIDYSMYEKWVYDKDVFEIPQPPNGDWCWNASKFNHQGDGGEFVMNPVAEFISSPHDDDPMDSEFHRYKKKLGKVYDKKEHSKRKHIFKHNARFIHSINRRNLNFKLKVNFFADMTDKEYGLHNGALPDSYEERKRGKRSIKLIHENYKPRKHSPEIPDELDWRIYGAVSEPRGQGLCGSCWAFTAVGAMEVVNFMKTGKLVELSEQQLVDCTWEINGLERNSGNNGCRGGLAWKAFFWARNNKIATRESYSPYRAQEGYCKTENFTDGVQIYGFRRVKTWSAIALRKAVAYHGPAAVSINSRPISLKFYSSGILDDKSCDNRTNHAVLVVGYGKENGTNYWLIKNSWSTLWGDKGYVKIKENFCGVLRKPVVVYDKHLKHYLWKEKGHRHEHKRKKYHRKEYKNSKKRRRKHWDMDRYGKELLERR